jgi:hypothetical protein
MQTSAASPSICDAREAIPRPFSAPLTLTFSLQFIDAIASLDDWEKEWKKNPQGIIKPAVVQVDFRSQHGGKVPDGVGVIVTA